MESHVTCGETLTGHLAYPPSHNGLIVKQLKYLSFCTKTAIYEYGLNVHSHNGTSEFYHVGF
jgi:hypothetical protein